MKIKKILISQPEPAKNSPYFDIASRHGVDITFRQFIKTEGLTAKEFRQSKINLADYTAIVFTTRAAVDNFFRLCKEMRVAIPDTLKYFCTSESLALYLQKYIVYRKRKIFFGATGRLNDPQLIAAINKHHKERFLLPVSNVDSTDPATDLKGVKATITPVVIYRTVSNDFTEGEAIDYDMLLFFSSHGIGALLKNFPDWNEKHPDVQIACFGPATVKAAKEAGLRVDIEAPNPEHHSMTGALDAYLEENA